MRLRYFGQFLMLHCLLLSGAAVAADDESLLDDDLLSLMAETTTSIASRTAETIVSAPAKVTVFTRQDILNLGVHNLYDLLEYMPAYTNLSKFHGLSARFNGLNTSSFQVYRDGVLVGSPFLSHISFPYIDLGNVERVEIMHGSGAVLYGTGAASGVIHVISRKNQKHVSAGIGSYDRKRLVANWHGEDKASGLVANLAVQSQVNRGRLYENLTNSWGELYDSHLNQPGKDQIRGPHEAELQVDIDRLTLRGAYRESEASGGHALPSYGLSLDNSEFVREKLLHANYELKPFAGWEGKVGLLYKQQDGEAQDKGYPGVLTGSTAQFVGYEHSDSIRTTRFESYLNKKLDEKHNVQLGLETQQDKMIKAETTYLGDVLNPQPEPVSPKLPAGLKARQTSVHIQHKGQWTPKLATTVGLRHMFYKLNEQAIDDTSYRLAANYQATPKHIFKLIHSESFDTLDVEAALVHPGEFSQVRSTELIYEFNNPKVVFSAGFDHKQYSQENYQVQGSGDTRVSYEEFETSLFKLDATVRINNEWKLTMAASKPLSSNTLGENPSSLERFQPSFIASAGVTYQKNPFTFNASLTSRGGYRPDATPDKAGVPQRTEFHTNLRYQFAKQGAVVLSGRNLLDEITSLEELQGETQSMYAPSSRGRELYLGVEYDW